MDNADIQKKCNDFLASLGVPGILFFGWEKPDVDNTGKAEKQYGFVYSYRKFPKEIAVKGLTWALSEVVNSPKKKGSTD